MPTINWDIRDSQSRYLFGLSPTNAAMIRVADEFIVNPTPSSYAKFSVYRRAYLRPRFANPAPNVEGRINQYDPALPPAFAAFNSTVATIDPNGVPLADRVPGGPMMARDSNADNGPAEETVFAKLREAAAVARRGGAETDASAGGFATFVTWAAMLATVGFAAEAAAAASAVGASPAAAIDAGANAAIEAGATVGAEAAAGGLAAIPQVIDKVTVPKQPPASGTPAPTSNNLRMSIQPVKSATDQLIGVAKEGANVVGETLIGVGDTLMGGAGVVGAIAPIIGGGKGDTGTPEQATAGAYSAPKKSNAAAYVVGVLAAIAAVMWG